MHVTRLPQSNKDKRKMKRKKKRSTNAAIMPFYMPKRSGMMNNIFLFFTCSIKLNLRIITLGSRDIRATT